MEPRIEIKGTRLTDAQAMAVRMACTAYLIEMDEPDALGDDDLGRKMAQAYRDRLNEVMLLMVA